MDQPSGTIAPPAPRTPRSLGWWLRRLLLLLAVVVVGGHFLWCVGAQRRLDATLRNLHDAGEPIYPADFDSPVPPPGQNAVDDLIAAGELIKSRGADAKDFDLLLIELPLTPKEIEIIKAELPRRQRAIDLAESAAGKTQVHWPIDHSVPTIMLEPAYLSGSRGVALTLQADALLAHQEGREQVALQRIGEIRAIGRIVDGQSTLIAHLVALGTAAMASDMAGNMAADLQIGGERGASPAQVRALIDDLLDERPLREGMSRALQGERRDHWQTITRLLEGTLKVSPAKETQASSLQLYWIKPIFLNDADLMVRICTRVKLEFEKSHDLPTFRANCDIERLYPEIWKRPMLHTTSSILLPSYGRSIATQYRVVTDQRLAATALALRAYAVDHDGHWPGSLEALTPKYLPAVPLDPMAAGAAPLRCRLEGADPILYSVGEDARDDGGSEAPLHKQIPGEPVQRWSARDAVMHLKRQPRYFPPLDE